MSSGGDRSEEVARLARDNASLVELNTALKDGNAALKDANAALKDLVASLQNERAALLGQQTEHIPTEPSTPTVSDADQAPHPRYRNEHVCVLPQEILLRIFLATIPSDDDHDAFVQAALRTPWTLSVKTRRALTLVCKTWYGAASEALYADIALRRMGQISALARTLRSARVVYAPDPSGFVKRIRMVGCIVVHQCAQVARADLTLILQYCSRLQSFEYHPHPHFDHYDTLNEDPIPDIEKWHNPVWFRSPDEDTPGGALADRCASGLQHLVFAQIKDEEHLIYIHHLLVMETRLTTLILGPFETLDFFRIPALSRQPPVVLPYLERLQIPRDLLYVQNYISYLWDIPNLRWLTVLASDEIPEDALELFGKHLKYLHVIPKTSWIDNHAHRTLSLLPTLCPVLEHLVLPNLPTLNLPCIIASPTLRYLDIWGLTLKRRVVELMCEMGHACSLPALRAIRMLSPRAPTSVVAQARLPLLCDPEEVSGDAVRVRTLPGGVRALQTSWAVLLDLGGDIGDDVQFFGVTFDDDGESDADGGSEYIPDVVVETGGEEVNEDAAGDQKDDGEEDEELDDGTSWVSDSDSEAYANEDDGEDEVEDEDKDEDAGEGEDGFGSGSDDEDPQPYDRETVLEMYSRSQKVNFSFDDEADL